MQKEEKRTRIVIVGAGGRLGAALLRAYGGDYPVVGFRHSDLDLADPGKIGRALGDLEFDCLINAAALTAVDHCETHREEAFAINAEAPQVLAEICRDHGARLIHFSTDYVFDGEKRMPYREEDEARPLSVYGESKLEGEQRVLAVDERHLIARVSWVFGPDRASFVDWIIDRAREDEKVSAVADKISAPTYTMDIAEMVRPFIDRQMEGGIVHFANGGECSWQEYGQWALQCCEAEGIPLRTRTVEAISLRDMKNFVARRPIYTVLSTEKLERLTGQTPRDWRAAVAEYVRTVKT